MKRARDEGARAVTEPPRPAVDPREIDHDAPRDPAARDACAKFFLNNLPEPDAPPECAPPPEETKAFAKSELATRGDSHGLEHAETVRALALAIWDDGAGEFEATKALAEETGFDATKVVETAALLHDVCDHKYVDDATAAGREAVARRDAFLANALPEAEAAAVLAIVAAVSYSREAKALKKGVPPAWETLDEPARTLRHVVSDADKIDAIGVRGLGRCAAYARERGVKGAVNVVAEVAAHCDEKLLKLRGEFVRTERGRELAKAGHFWLRTWRCEAKRAGLG